MKEYTMRIYYEVLGGHTHITIWTEPRNGQVGKCGDIIMTNEEFQAWQSGAIRLEFFEKGSTPPHQQFRAGAGQRE